MANKKCNRVSFFVTYLCRDSRFTALQLCNVTESSVGDLQVANSGICWGAAVGESNVRLVWEDSESAFTPSRNRSLTPLAVKLEPVGRTRTGGPPPIPVLGAGVAAPPLTDVGRRGKVP